MAAKKKNVVARRVPREQESGQEQSNSSLEIPEHLLFPSAYVPDAQEAQDTAVETHEPLIYDEVDGIPVYSFGALDGSANSQLAAEVEVSYGTEQMGYVNGSGNEVSIYQNLENYGSDENQGTSSVVEVQENQLQLVESAPEPSGSACSGIVLPPGHIVLTGRGEKHATYQESNLLYGKYGFPKQMQPYHRGSRLFVTLTKKELADIEDTRKAVNGVSFACHRTGLAESNAIGLIEHYHVQDRLRRRSISKLARSLFGTRYMRKEIETENVKVNEKNTALQHEVTKYENMCQQLIHENNRLRTELAANTKTEEQSLFYNRKFNEAVDEVKAESARKSKGDKEKIKKLIDNNSVLQGKVQRLTKELAAASKENAEVPAAMVQQKDFGMQVEITRFKGMASISTQTEQESNNNPGLPVLVPTTNEDVPTSIWAAGGSGLMDQIGDTTVPQPVIGSCDKVKLNQQIEQAGTNKEQFGSNLDLVEEQVEVESFKGMASKASISTQMKQEPKKNAGRALPVLKIKKEKEVSASIRASGRRRLMDKIGDTTVPQPVIASCDKVKFSQQIEHARAKKRPGSNLDLVLEEHPKPKKPAMVESCKPSLPPIRTIPFISKPRLQEARTPRVVRVDKKPALELVPAIPTFLSYDSPTSPPIPVSSTSKGLNYTGSAEDARAAEEVMKNHFHGRGFDNLKESADIVCRALKNELRFPPKNLAKAVFDTIISKKTKRVKGDDTFTKRLVLFTELVEKSKQKGFGRFIGDLLHDFEFLVSNDKAKSNDMAYRRLGEFCGVLLENRTKEIGVGSQNELALDVIISCMFWHPNRAFAFLHDLLKQHSDPLNMYKNTYNIDNTDVAFKVILYVIHRGKKGAPGITKRLREFGNKSLNHPDTKIDHGEFVKSTMAQLKRYESDKLIKRGFKAFRALSTNFDNWIQFGDFAVEELNEMKKDYLRNKLSKAILVAFIDMIGDLGSDLRKSVGNLDRLREVIGEIGREIDGMTDVATRCLEKLDGPNQRKNMNVNPQSPQFGQLIDLGFNANVDGYPPGQMKGKWPSQAQRGRGGKARGGKRFQGDPQGPEYGQPIDLSFNAGVGKRPPGQMKRKWPPQAQRGRGGKVRGGRGGRGGRGRGGKKFQGERFSN